MTSISIAIYTSPNVKLLKFRKNNIYTSPYMKPSPTKSQNQQKSSIFSGYPGPTYADRKTGTSRCQKSNLQIHIFRGKFFEKKILIFS